MNIKTLFAITLICFGLSAAAEDRIISRAYEINLSNFTVPVTSSGLLLFKDCADCDSRRVRMTRNTRFVVNGKSVELKEFRKNVFHVRDRESKTIIVMHHLESDTVTSVSVSL